MVNERDMAMKDKVENEAKWKTKSGFDYIQKKENWNEHPKKPDQSKLDDLAIPYVIAMQESKAKLGSQRCGPLANGQP